MDNVMQALNKLIAEPFHAKDRAIWMHPSHMEQLKAEMAGVPKDSIKGDKSVILVFNNVPIITNYFCPLGKMYVMNADDIPPNVLPLP